MKAATIKKKHGKEYYIQQDIIKFLRDRNWFVLRLAGGAFMSGAPDLFASHSRYKQRWIEIKVEEKHSFTRAQRIKFPEFMSHGCPIWILTGSDSENYKRLFKPSNLGDYLDV